MTDSADMANAAKRLERALAGLEGSLSPLLSKVARLEKTAVDSQAFTEDRSRLATELDVAKSQNEKYMAREAEFNRLADVTTQELDRVIADVQRALEKGA
ncbi:MAG: DUF4164 family protein [Litorimonas sp.]